METKLHYLELELKGGGPPFPLPPDKKIYGPNNTCFIYDEDGTKSATIGIVAGDEPRCFSDTTVPDNSYVWHREGAVVWPDNTDGEPPLLGRIYKSPLSDDYMLKSGDRVGVLIDFHADRLGFTRNGRLERRLSRRLSVVRRLPPLRFVAGGLRPNTTWRIVPPDRARATLERGVDWVWWTAPPPPPGTQAAEALEEGGDGGIPDPYEVMPKILPAKEWEHLKAFLERAAGRAPKSPRPEGADEIVSASEGD